MADKRVWIVEVSKHKDVTRSALQMALADANNLRQNLAFKLVHVVTEIPSAMGSPVGHPVSSVNNRTLMEHARRVQQNVILPMMSWPECKANKELLVGVIEPKDRWYEGMMAAVDKYGAERVYIGVKKALLGYSPGLSSIESLYSDRLAGRCTVVAVHGYKRLRSFDAIQIDMDLKVEEGVEGESNAPVMYLEGPTTPGSGSSSTRSSGFFERVRSAGDNNDSLRLSGNNSPTPSSNSSSFSRPVSGSLPPLTRDGSGFLVPLSRNDSGNQLTALGQGTHSSSSFSSSSLNAYRRMSGGGDAGGVNSTGSMPRGGVAGGVNSTGSMHIGIASGGGMAASWHHGSTGSLNEICAAGGAGSESGSASNSARGSPAVAPAAASHWLAAPAAAAGSPGRSSITVGVHDPPPSISHSPARSFGAVGGGLPRLTPSGGSQPFRPVSHGGYEPSAGSSKLGPGKIVAMAHGDDQPHNPTATMNESHVMWSGGGQQEHHSMRVSGSNSRSSSSSSSMRGCTVVSQSGRVYTCSPEVEQQLAASGGGWEDIVADHLARMDIAAGRAVQVGESR